MLSEGLYFNMSFQLLIFGDEYMKKKLICIYLCTLLIIPLFATTVSANGPPTTPEISSPTEVKLNEENEFTFMSTDPEGDDVYYWIEWAPCCFIDFRWHGPFDSGEEAIIYYAYECDGDLQMRVKAKDINGSESDWATFEISVPKSIIFNPFINFLEQHPLLFSIFRQLLRL